MPTEINKHPLVFRNREDGDLKLLPTTTSKHPVVFMSVGSGSLEEEEPPQKYQAVFMKTESRGLVEPTATNQHQVVVVTINKGEEVWSSCLQQQIKT